MAKAQQACLAFFPSLSYADFFITHMGESNWSG